MVILEKELKVSERGKVFLVRDKETKERLICREFVGNGEVYQKLKTLDCPHVPKIKDLEEKDGTVYVLEEYIQGDTLAFLLAGRPLSDRQAADIMVQLCQALDVLHSAGIVHRDIKPENIILRGDEAVLIDFDASRVCKPERNSDTQVMGTAGYAAPEQFGFSQTDARADIYAMGVLLNEMLIRQHPAKKLAEGMYLPVIAKCIEVNVDRRYASAKELLFALEALPADTNSRSKGNRTLRGVIIGVLAVCAVLGGTLFAASRPGNRQKDDAVQEQPPVHGETESTPEAETMPSEEGIALHPGQWNGESDGDGIPIVTFMRFAYDLDGDGASEDYIFGTSLHNGDLSSTLVISDWVNLAGASGAVRIPVPGVWREMDNGQLALAPEFADLISDAAITVWRGTNLAAPAPKITPYDCEWKGGLRIEYTREHIGIWVYEVTAMLNGQELRSVSKTTFVLSN